MVEQIEVFRAKLHWLFAGRGCLNTGYTHWALTHLRKGKLVPLPGKGPCLVGGRGEAEPSSLITECRGRMVAWSALASEVASTECPEFELLACFQVFKLTEPFAITIHCACLPRTTCSNLQGSLGKWHRAPCRSIPGTSEDCFGSQGCRRTRCYFLAARCSENTRQSQAGKFSLWRAWPIALSVCGFAWLDNWH